MTSDPRLRWSVNLHPHRLSATLDPAELDGRARTALDRVAQLGASYVRVDLLWSWVCPEPGRVDPEAVRWYRRFAAMAADRGIGLFAILYGPPAWAQRLLGSAPAFADAWRRYVAAVAEGLGDHLGLVQVWNEPNNYFSPMKGDFNLFRRVGPSRPGAMGLPVGVHWDLLGDAFRIARAELPPTALTVYNALTNLSDFTPLRHPAWVDWDRFTDRLLAEAGDAIDAVAIDHYPDTWAAGGPDSWAPLDLLIARVNDPKSPWHGKTALVAETGFSSCDNVKVGWPWPVAWMYAREHDVEHQAAWFAAAAAALAHRLTPERLPANRLFLANVYELADTGRQVARDQVLRIEHHFGLLTADLAPKPAYHLLQRVLAGEFELQPDRHLAWHPGRSPYVEAVRSLKGWQVVRDVPPGVQEVGPAASATFAPGHVLARTSRRVGWPTRILAVLGLLALVPALVVAGVAQLTGLLAGPAAVAFCYLSVYLNALTLAASGFPSDELEVACGACGARSHHLEPTGRPVPVHLCPGCLAIVTL